MPFSEQTLHFLVENRLNNSREWYQEHKGDYQRLVLEPMMELVEKLAPTMLEIDPKLVTEPKVDKTLSRVYRDTRFSKDKSLYREVMWCVFARDRKVYECPPGFVLEFSPDGFRYGCGYFDAPPKVMEAIRALVLENGKRFRAAQEAFERQAVFQMEGEVYKRARYPDHPDSQRLWLERRCIALMHSSKDFDLFYSDRLHETLSEHFRLLKPVYDLFCAATQTQQ